MNNNKGVNQMKKMVVLFTVVSIILISTMAFAGEKGNDIGDAMYSIGNPITEDGITSFNNEVNSVTGVVLTVKILWRIYQPGELIDKTVNWSIYGNTEPEVQEKYFEKLQNEIERYDNMYDGASYNVISSNMRHLSPCSIGDEEVN